MKPILVVKVGSSTLTVGTDQISRGKIEDIARQIVKLHEDYDIILVSSGAVAAAKQIIDLKKWKNLVESKQAMSAIGQPRLMQIYSEVFSDFNIKIAQCLLTHRDFENTESKRNTKNTIAKLLEHNYVPVINENDTVAVDELILGDNDKLSAYVATLVDADKLIIASDIDGLYDKNPHLHKDAKLIEKISDLDEVKKYIEEKDDGLGTGGMTSKIKAVEICQAKNTNVLLVNGGKENFIINSLNGSLKSTKFDITRKA